MSFGRYVAGIALWALTLGLLGLAAHRVRRAVVGATDVFTAFVVELVLVVAGLVLVPMVLGTVGAFRTGPIIGGYAAVTIAVVLIARTRPDASPPGRSVEETPPRGWPKWLLFASLFGLAVRWGERFLDTFPGGTQHADVLHYHLTMAARFAQTGHTWPISFWSIGEASSYHPGSSSLIHAIGLLYLRSDVSSFFVNLPFVLLALAATWRIGVRRGNGPAAALFMIAILALRYMSAEAGQAVNDVMSLSLLTATVALLDVARDDLDRRRFVWLAGLAGGLALGTKLTVLVPVGGLLLVVWAVRPRDRGRSTVAFVGASLLGGGYWYLRNLAATGTPVPALDLGPLQGPSLPILRAFEGTILDYIGQVDIWRTYFLPGLHSAFGPFWPLFPAVALGGAIAVALSPTVRRTAPGDVALAAVALLAFGSYLINPTSAAGPPGDPWLFNANLRYSLPALLLAGLVTLGHPIARRHPGAAAWVAFAMVVACSAYKPDPQQAGIALLVALLGATLVWAGLRSERRTAWLLVALVAIAAVPGGYAFSKAYDDHRFTDHDVDRFAVYDAVQDLDGARIAVTGQPQSYPFYGRHLQNHVQVLGRVVDHALAPIDDCRAWWHQVDGFDFVAILSDPKLLDTDYGRTIVSLPEAWLDDAGADLVLDGHGATLYSLAGTTPSC